MRMLVAMSGGVDSSVAALLLRDAGYDVVGATMKLWGGPSDSGCCSVGDVEDARRVAQQLGIVHHVFNFTDDFDRHVVDPYVAGHAAGRTPNPCIECNRHLKFDRFLDRADRLGFDAIATGHHARVVAEVDGGWSLRRAADAAKDQSYVLSMLGQLQLARTRLPIGDMTKTEVRRRAAAAGLRTAAKPDSQDVCFIAAGAGGRTAFLGDRIPLHAARVVSRDGAEVGSVPAVELVTVGQRRGLPFAPDGRRRFAVAVDVPGRTVTVGTAEDVLVDHLQIDAPTWVRGEPAVGTQVDIQASAHGTPVGATWRGAGAVELAVPIRLVARGQTVALYDGDRVLGAGLAT